MTPAPIMLITLPHLYVQYYLFQELSLPRLVTYLQHKHIPVIQYNLDDEIYDVLLSKQGMLHIFSRLRTVTLPRYRSDHTFRNSLNRQLREFVIRSPYCNSLHINGDTPDLLGILLFHASQITTDISSAVHILRTRFTTTGADAFFEHFDRFCLGIQLLCCAHHPTVYDPFKYLIQFPYSPLKIKDVLRAVRSTEGNFLIPYFQEHLVPRIIEQRPQILGLSVNIPQQFIPALTLLDQVRQKLPGTHIILGGTFVSSIAPYMQQDNELWPYFDSLCYGPGEYTLETLTSCLNKKKPLHRVPNILYREGARIKITPLRPLNMREIRTAEFAERRPRPLIPIRTAQGCPTRKCVFCNNYRYNQVCLVKRKKPGYHPRPLKMVMQELIDLKQRHDPLLFLLTDLDMPPRRRKKFVSMVLTNTLNIKFSMLSRAEKIFLDKAFCQDLARAGCVMLHMGLEAGAQRVNDLMQKGITVTDTEKILKNLTDAGIITNLFVMTGFPTETREEIERTRTFIRDQRSSIGNLIIESFALCNNTMMEHDPERYGLSNLISDRTKNDFPMLIDHTVTSSLSRADITTLTNRIEQEFYARDKNIHLPENISHYLSYTLLHTLIKDLVG